MISKLGQRLLVLAIINLAIGNATICGAFADESQPPPPSPPTGESTQSEPKPAMEETRLDLPTNRPDPFAARKTELSSRIENIKSSGAGVSPFLKQMDEIDALRKANTPDDVIGKRYDSLSRSIDDQIERMKALKQYHPIATSPSHISNTSGGPIDSASVLHALRGRFGSSIPSGVSDEKLQQYLKTNPKAQQALKGLNIK